MPVVITTQTNSTIIINNSDLDGEMVIYTDSIFISNNTTYNGDNLYNYGYANLNNCNFGLLHSEYNSSNLLINKGNGNIKVNDGCSGITQIYHTTNCQLIATHNQNSFIYHGQLKSTEYKICNGICGSCSACGCFTYDTPIFTTKGFKKIGDLNFDDILYTFNFEKGTIEESPILQKLIHNMTNETILTINNDDGKLFDVTLDHRFMFDDNQWYSIGEYIEKTGKTVFELMTTKGLERVYVSDEKIYDRIEVFNLTMLKNKNYIVSNNKIIAHNIKH